MSEVVQEPPLWAIKRARAIVGIGQGDPTALTRLIALALDAERRKDAKGRDVLVPRELLDGLRSDARSLLFFVKQQPPDDSEHAADLQAVEGEILARAEKAERILGVTRG